MKARRKKPNVMVLFGWSDPEGFAAVSQTARTLGWHLELRTYYTEAVPEHWDGDGILYTKGLRDRIDHFVMQQAARCPVVALNSNLPSGLDIPIVAPDNAAAGRMAALHLIEQGHRDFAYYSPVSGAVSEERRKGFEEAVQESGLRLHRFPIRRVSRTVSWSVQHRQLVAHLRKLPPQTALLALDDLVAADVIEVAVENGLRVPEDLAVVGIGNLSSVCEFSPIPITSVDLRSGEVARQAAELLGLLMNGGKRPKSVLRIPPGSLIARESSNTTIVRDPRLAKSVAYIRKHLRHSLSLDQIAEASGVSRRTLYHLFCDDLGMTPAAYIRQQRNQQANRLLAEQPDITWQEAAVQTGFACTRTLRRHLGRK